MNEVEVRYGFLWYGVFSWIDSLCFAGAIEGAVLDFFGGFVSFLRWV